MSEKTVPDLSKFNLRYERRRDNKIFYVQRLVDGDYMLLDPETNETERLTRKRLRTRYAVVKKQASQDAA